MNYTTAVMLINQNIRAVHCVYEPETEYSKPERKMFKTLDPELKEGDYVVVPTETRHKMTVMQVVAVDVDVDFESSIKIDWIVDRVNVEANQLILDEEAMWIDKLKQSEKRRKREEIKKNMLDMHKDDGLEDMAIAQMGQEAPVKAIEDSK